MPDRPLDTQTKSAINAATVILKSLIDKGQHGPDATKQYENELSVLNNPTAILPENVKIIKENPQLGSALRQLPEQIIEGEYEVLDPDVLTRERRLELSRQAQREKETLETKRELEEAEKKILDARASRITAGGVAIDVDKLAPQPENLPSNIIYPSNTKSQIDHQRHEDSKQAQEYLRELQELEKIGYVKRTSHGLRGSGTLVGAQEELQPSEILTASKYGIQHPTGPAPQIPIALPNDVIGKLGGRVSDARHKISKEAQTEVRHLAAKRIEATLAKAGGKKLALWAGAALTGIGTIATVLGIAGTLISQLRKHPEAFLAVGTWLYTQIAALIHALVGSAITLGTTIAGGILGGILGSAIPGIGTVFGAATGAAAGNIVGRFLTGQIAQQGGLSSAAGNALHSVVSESVAFDATTGAPVFVEAPAYNLISAASSSTGAIVSVPLFGAMGMAAFGTFFATMHIIAAFTVPNPVISDIPYPGGTLAFDPSYYGGIIPQPAPALSGNLNQDIQAAAQAACVPTALVAAIMQTESNAYGWSNEKYQNFSTEGWWLTGGPQGQNCYSGHFSRSTAPGSDCATGYCYDTCTETGLCGKKLSNCTPGQPNVCSATSPSALPCPPDGNCSFHDVYGATQFTRVSFYGGGCEARDGNGPQCTEGNGAGGNRCNVSNIVNATATKIHFDTGASCPFNPSHWTTAAICNAARKYCGSCGMVVNEVTESMYTQNPNQHPCFPYYGDTASSACGGSGNEGYCDKVYKLYIGSGGS